MKPWNMSSTFEGPDCVWWCGGIELVGWLCLWLGLRRRRRALEIELQVGIGKWIFFSSVGGGYRDRGHSRHKNGFGSLFF